MHAAILAPLAAVAPFSPFASFPPFAPLAPSTSPGTPQARAVQAPGPAGRGRTRQGPLPLAGLLAKIRRAQAMQADPMRCLAQVSPWLRRYALSPSAEAFDLPAVSQGLYVRRRLSAPDDAFQLIVACWAPGSASPIHDHDDVTGAVVALCGQVSETRHERLGRAGPLVRLAARPGWPMALGEVSPILPDEAGQLHDMRNSSATLGYTLHLYLRPLVHFNTYQPVGDGLYQAEARRLWLD